jgi:hypothetical protein
MLNVLALVKHIVEHNGLQIDQAFKDDLDKGLKDAEAVASDVVPVVDDAKKEVEENS